MRRALCRASCLLALVLLPLAAIAADLAEYREFRLGASTADVVMRARVNERDVAMLHERPARLQELSWRTPYNFLEGASGRDSVRGIVFSFVDDRLYRMVVDYDTGRTEGLTTADMVSSLTSLYGAPSAPTMSGARPTEALDAQTVLAEWRENDTTVELQYARYGSRFSLVITDVKLDERARQMRAAAVALEAREAPAREAAKARAEAEAAAEAAEKRRRTNRSTFEP